MNKEYSDIIEFDGRLWDGRYSEVVEQDGHHLLMIPFRFYDHNVNHDITHGFQIETMDDDYDTIARLTMTDDMLLLDIEEWYNILSSDDMPELMRLSIGILDMSIILEEVEQE